MIGLFVVLSAGSGCGFYALSAFSRDLTDRGHFGLGTVSTGATVFLLASGFGGLPIAAGVARLGVRGVLVIGVVGMATALAVLGHIDSPWLLWLDYGIAGAASAAIAMVPASLVIVQWYPMSPARPMALATTGISVGGVVIAPFLADWVDASGLRRVGPLLAVTMIAVLLPVILLLVRAPSDRTNNTDRTINTENTHRTENTDAVTRPEPIGPPTDRLLFLAITLAFALMLMSQVSVVTTLLNIAGERGIRGSALALSAIAAASVTGRLLGIPLLTVLGLRGLTIGVGALQAVAMWVIAGASGSWELVAGVSLLGLTVGNVVVLLPLWILAGFGRGPYGRLYARANLLTTFGVAGGPAVIALLHHVFGGFTAPLILLGCGSALAATLLARVRRLDGERMPAPLR